MLASYNLLWEQVNHRGIFKLCSLLILMLLTGQFNEIQLLLSTESRCHAVAVPSEQVDPVFHQSVSGLAGQREGTVLVVGDAGVPQRSPVLLEVSLLGHAAGSIHSSSGTPAVKIAHFHFKHAGR